MTHLLKLAAVTILFGSVLAEGSRILDAPGVSLSLGACLGGYLWFLAVARRAQAPSRWRRR
ncbi:MAG: hypothetical protein AB1625_10105 [Acidobacteriota bacterium]